MLLASSLLAAEAAKACLIFGSQKVDTRQLFSDPYRISYDFVFYPPLLTPNPPVRVPPAFGGQSDIIETSNNHTTTSP